MKDDQEIVKLRKQIDRLKNSVKKQRYGLVWMDIPEAFEDDVENKIPILKEVPELAIKSNDKKPQHILIEGDNYHALTCLNYTHKGKIDVIYIDPPYNTGSDGFRYKDKRIIDKFPDGTEVPRDHPFRHSYWLSFMRKRLELARDLLAKEGMIFISIDDNEVAQLKLLCNEIFIENNFLGTITWEKRTKAQNTETAREMLQSKTEYILVYRNQPERVRFNLEISGEKDYPEKDLQGIFRYKKVEEMSARGMRGRKTMVFPIRGIDPRKGFQWKYGKEEVQKYQNRGDIEIKKGKPYFKIRPQDEDNKKFIPFWSHFFDKESAGTAEKGKTELTNILRHNTHDFETVKPIDLIKKLLSHIKMPRKGIILDFFAGSGTTLHSAVELNESDDLGRQVILVTNNEGNIMQDVCYPRLKNVILGYKNLKSKPVKGLGNSLKYYKTDFIGKNNILEANDEDKVELAHNAGELLAIAENTLELVKQTKYYQLFEDHLKEKYTAVYFREELDQFDKFTDIVKKLDRNTTVYVFSWGTDEFIDDFDGLNNIKIKTIPVPILEIYKNIYNLVS